MSGIDLNVIRFLNNPSPGYAHRFVAAGPREGGVHITSTAGTPDLLTNDTEITPITAA